MTLYLARFICMFTVIDVIYPHCLHLSQQCLSSRKNKHNHTSSNWLELDLSAGIVIYSWSDNSLDSVWKHPLGEFLQELPQQLDHPTYKDVRLSRFITGTSLRLGLLLLICSLCLFISIFKFVTLLVVTPARPLFRYLPLCTPCQPAPVLGCHIARCRGLAYLKCPAGRWLYRQNTTSSWRVRVACRA